MRIITGKLGHHLFDSPKGRQTHPMSEKIRGALFNMLGDINNLTVLDAFGGSGALAFESISRGARSAYILEPDKTAFKIIVQNIATLGISDQVVAKKKFAASWSSGTCGRSTSRSRGSRRSWDRRWTRSSPSTRTVS